MSARQLRLAIIGCGAVAETAHVPALVSLGRPPVLLADTNLERARLLAQRANAPHVTRDYRTHVEEIDAAIVALPHSLHGDVCTDLLQRGIHVLVEKPMATTSAQCRTMIAAARSGGAALTVGLVRRFMHSAVWTKAALDAEILGEIKSVDIREGSVYNWPCASNSFFRKETAGGGVLIDTGAHTLDLLLWWMGEAELLQYRDDSHGGVEADCELHLLLPSGARGIVELSRLRALRNTAIIRGSHGEIEVSLHSNIIRAKPRHLLRNRFGKLVAGRLPNQDFFGLFTAQLGSWISALEKREPPKIPAAEAARSVALIEACYRQRLPLPMPWHEPELVVPDLSAVEARECSQAKLFS